ncbi:CDP-glycerol glycerophosphotransferase family protein [Chloroflexota bacterium]
MKCLAFLLDGAIDQPLDLPPGHAGIVLSATNQRYADGLIDGEQTYALFALTEQADNLAMEWSRTAYAALVSTSWKSAFIHRGIDLKPLVINRLFRGFFLDRARIYLAVKRILEAEAPQCVTIYTADDVNARFAHAACLAAGIEPARFYLPATRHRMRIPRALEILMGDIAAPALGSTFSKPSSSPSSPEIPHIVFIQRGSMGGKMVRGAFQALQTEHRVAITTVRFEPEDSGQEYPGVRYVDWDDYQDLGTLSPLLVYQARVMTEGSGPADWSDPLLCLVGPKLVRFLKHVALPSIVHTLEVTRKVIQKEHPHLLVVTDETGLLGKAVAVQGRKWDIPTLNVQHGVRTDSPWIDDQLFDHFAVFGPSSSKVFVQRGNTPSMFVSTGSARYDRLFRREGIKPRQQVIAELGLDSSQPIVTFASQRAWGRMTPAVKRETLLALLRACQKSGVQIVVKLRHSQDDYIPVEATREPGWESVCVTADYDLYDLLDASAVVVTVYSTVGMEAVALGKPLLIINLTGQPDAIPYVQEGVAAGAYQPDQVGPALQLLLNTGQPSPGWAQCRQDFIRRHLTSDDGCSAERIARLILNMITD